MSNFEKLLELYPDDKEVYFSLLKSLTKNSIKQEKVIILIKLLEWKIESLNTTDKLKEYKEKYSEEILHYNRLEFKIETNREILKYIKNKILFYTYNYN